MKPVVWLGDSRARVKDFPGDARRVTGYELDKIQDGREPADIELARRRFRALIEERRRR